LQIIPIGTAQPTGTNYPGIVVNTNVINGAASIHTQGLLCQQAAIFAPGGNFAPCVYLAARSAGTSVPSQTLQFHATGTGGGDVPLDILVNTNGTTNVPFLTPGQASALVFTNVFSRTTAQTAANITTTGFGTGCGGAGACISAVSGFGQRFVLTITPGAAPGANPTFTATFSDAMPYAPICMALQQQQNGTGAFFNFSRGTETVTSTGAITLTGTPIAGSTYQIVVDCRL
jgi:hypothetical protein